MQALYVSQQGCYLSLKQESVLVKQGQTVIHQMQLPLLEQILVFGSSQLTTQVIRACLWREIPIAYLSRMGTCYGRVLPIAQGYRQLMRRQQQLSTGERLTIAQTIVHAKLSNSRVLLLRQQRRLTSEVLEQAIAAIAGYIRQVAQATDVEQLRGFEGAGAASYFSAFGQCVTNPAFEFKHRSKRPPTDPVNALLSFGYQVLWNHLLSLIELQDLDPYDACLHQSSDRHAALVSDLIEAFRVPIVDSIVLYLVNRGIVNAEDFDFPTGACYLNESGRRKYLGAFVRRMEEMIQVGTEQQPRWDGLMQQVKAYKQFVYDPTKGFQPYRIR